MVQLGDMLRPLLVLLSEVAVLAQRELAVDGSLNVVAVAAHLGSLLPSIATLCRKTVSASRNQHPSKSHTRGHRVECSDNASRASFDTS
jgi:hypothetical protein